MAFIIAVERNPTAVNGILDGKDKSLHADECAVFVNNADIGAKMRALRRLGVPYSDEEIAQGPADLKGKTEQDALIAYLQVLGTAGRAGAAK